VLDADIRGFFDAIDHERLVKLIEHRVADRRVVRLIRKWLNAGVLVEGEWTRSEKGTPQGGVMTPPTQRITRPGIASRTGDRMPNHDALGPYEHLSDQEANNTLAV
jgi:retron-type reverse transcriptase